jgi:hypothetical protein
MLNLKKQSNYLGGARFARKEGECGLFFGRKPENKPPLLSFCERREQKAFKMS